MVGNVRYEHVGGEHFRLSAGLTLAAILTAFIGLFRERIPPILNVMFGTPLRLLRTLHSGIFTDYVAYIVFGIAAYTVWLVLAVP